MATQVEICNMALGLLGAENIVTISDNTRVAKVCSTFFNNTVLNLLRSHNWNFAMKRATLTAEVLPPAFEYKYSFAKPTDYLRVVSFYNYEYSFKEEGNYILLNQGTVQMKYIRNDIVVADYDDSFVACLASKLAHLMCYQITQSITLVPVIEKMHKEDLAQARRNNAISNTPDAFQKPTWLASRL
jgi:hypothetical protein